MRQKIEIFTKKIAPSVKPKNFNHLDHVGAWTERLFVSISTGGIKHLIFIKYKFRLAHFIFISKFTAKCIHCTCSMSKSFSWILEKLSTFVSMHSDKIIQRLRSLKKKIEYRYFQYFYLNLLTNRLYSYFIIFLRLISLIFWLNILVHKCWANMNKRDATNN